MKTDKIVVLGIASMEGLDATVGEIVRRKVQHKGTLAEMEEKIAAIRKDYAAQTGEQVDAINKLEGMVLQFCKANRAMLFTEKKSRETASAEIGFELTPHRVETLSRKITIKEVISRLIRLRSWGGVYIRNPEPQLDKAALLRDREKLTPEQTQAAGIQFVQDEQFFIRPKSEVAEGTSVLPEQPESAAKAA